MLQYTLWTYPSWFSMSQENRRENIDFLLATAMTVPGSGSWSSNYRDQQCYYHSPRLVCLLYFCNHILKNFFRECTFLLSPSHICLTPFCLTNSDDWTITGDNVLLMIQSEWGGCQKNGGLSLLIMKILKANENENVWVKLKYESQLKQGIKRELYKIHLHLSRHLIHMSPLSFSLRSHLLF